MVAKSIRSIGRALISVTDKSGIGDVGRTLDREEVSVISTGGTARALESAGCKVTFVENMTGFPEMMDGRLKTLHPRVHGGLLAVRDNPEHVAAMKKYDIQPIDLLIVNLYPFEETIKKGVTLEEAIENIDVGGPAMIRAAAKNHEYVAVVTSPSQYPGLLREFRNIGAPATTLAFRRRLMAEAFLMTSRYDAAIAEHFGPIFQVKTVA